MEKLTCLPDVIDYTLNILAENPERDALKAQKAAREGIPREFPVFGINHIGSRDDHFEITDEEDFPEIDINNSLEYSLAKELMSKLEPLKMLNPIDLSMNLGQGTGTLVTCFGIHLNPECDNTPAYNLSLDEILKKNFPVAAETGLMPQMKEQITIIKDNLPESIKIRMPDTQGPYNIAHALIGNDALMAPMLEPEKFHQFMTQLTTFWIEAVATLREWIGVDRLSDTVNRIAECSVNLISRETYEEFVLPCDLRIADAFGNPGIHTCSGPHVFHETLENIPNIVYTEAGYIPIAAAGYTKVADAIQTLGDLPIQLNIGQELHDENHFETIKEHFDYYQKNKRLLFYYTAMNQGKKDRPAIRELHNQLDNYWHENIGSE